MSFFLILAKYKRFEPEIHHFSTAVCRSDNADSNKEHSSLASRFSWPKSQQVALIRYHLRLFYASQKHSSSYEIDYITFKCCK